MRSALMEGWLVSPLLLGFSTLLLGSMAYDTPEDCVAAPLAGRPGTFRLSCRLSSINSRLERTNFSVIPSDTTVSLAVSCSQSNLGTLEPAGFSSLSLLEELVIEGCALDSVQRDAFLGLTSLRKLTVRTNNAAHGGLKVEAGAFSQLVNLTHLEVGGFREMPSAELCSLSSLVHLNMSGNEMGSAFDLGSVAGACLPALDTLDLSYNELTSLDADNLPSSARIIHLNNNYIRFVAPEVFSNSSVQILDLSNNQINHLPPTIFHNLSLHSLNLANNTMSSLAPHTFRHQKQLEILDISGNLLVSSFLLPAITEDLFSLMELDLSSNQIQNVPAELLANLPNLQILKLNSNRLSSFNIPQSLFQLRELDVSRNFLKKIGADDLAGFEALTLLSLSHNQIETIHPAVFKNTSNLLVLDISDNRLMAVPESLKYLTNLQTLDIGANFISQFDNSPLSMMESLWRLQMPNNMLQNISHAALFSMKSLQILDMSGNKIESIDRGAFDQNKLLRAIRLDRNQIREMEGIFTHLPELIWLNVSDNQITEFDYEMVSRTLHWLDISHNRIAELGNYFDLDGDLSLTYLNAGFNSLKSLAPHNLPDRLETVLLNDNQLSQVLPYTFFKKSKLVKVDLSVNEISSIGQTSLRLSSEVVDPPTFLLGGNPIICDCDMQWFKTINDNNSIQRYPLISDLESIYCRLVYTKEQAFIPLVEARNDQFLCSYDTHCFSLCQCCQFDSCDCEMTCPEGCSCYHDNSWTKNIIQCSATESQSIPDNIPMDATEIFLDGNNYHTLRSHTFIGRKNLRSLHLNNSNIEKIENHTFNGLKSLTSLHLQNNNIQSLQGFEFSTLSNLRELYLQGNQINFIHNATFKALKNLEVLFLQGNSIIDFPVWELAFNPYLVTIKLAENLWSCDCDYLHMFRTWLQISGPKVSDADLVSCISNVPEQENILVTDIAASPCDLINAVAKNQMQEQTSTTYMPLMIALLASLSMIVIFTFVVFGFRHSIKIWMDSSKTSERMIESPSPSSSTTADDGKLFDAYVSYSPRDTLFVNQVLCRELETSTNPYRICLHHRDLPANALVSDSVHRVSEASKKIIIVLSQNFLQTEWSRFDFKAGLLQSLSGGGKRIIFLVAGVIDLNLIDPTLRMLLKSGEVVSMSDPGLMSKLEFNVPERTETHYYSTCKFPSVYMEPDKKAISHMQAISHI